MCLQRRALQGTSTEARSIHKAPNGRQEVLGGTYPSQSGGYGQVDCKAKLPHAAQILSFQQQTRPGVNVMPTSCGFLAWQGAQLSCGIINE